MSDLLTLTNELNQCRQNLSNLEAKLKKCERNYESLRNFKGTLTTSQEEFETINSGGTNAFSEIESIKKDCRTAQKYQEGMTTVLNGIGAKMVGGLYSTMGMTVSLRLQKYLYDINTYDDEIARCRVRIDTLERKIAEAEKEPPVVVTMEGEVL